MDMVTSSMVVRSGLFRNVFGSILRGPSLISVPAHSSDRNRGKISVRIHLYTLGMANLFEWWVKFKVVDRKKVKRKSRMF